jgi:hypothetical protein
MSDTTDRPCWPIILPLASVRLIQTPDGPALELSGPAPSGVAPPAVQAPAPQTPAEQPGPWLSDRDLLLDHARRAGRPAAV